MGLTIVPPIEGEVYGRLRLFTDEKDITRANVVDVLTDAMTLHQGNSTRIHSLWMNYKGKQKILERVKTIRPEINNMIVENRAYEIVTFKTGYLLGEPMQYIADSADDEALVEKINRLNAFMRFEGKAAKDKELADWFHICGTSYRMALPEKDKKKSADIPFHIFTLDPRFSFVVYSSGIGHKPMMGVTYVIKKDGTVVYNVYTEKSFFEIEGDVVKSETPHNLRMIPIIEYPANTARLGAFEIVLPLLDAINEVASNRMDGVEQFVQSFMKFLNCDIDEQQFTALKELGAIKIKSLDGQKADVEIVTSELNQSQTQTLKDDLYQAVLDICGMPNRNGGNSTSDTGSAVIMRDGWSTAESRAKDTENIFKESEKLFLELVFTICRDVSDLDLKLPQIDMKFTRRNYSDLLTKSQVLTTMLGSPKVHPELAFTSCGMFVDPESAYTKSKKYAEEQEKKEQEKLARQQQVAVQNTAASKPTSGTPKPSTQPNKTTE